MGRNKIVYALSDVAVVVSSASGSGGTWAGAIEAIKGGWVPVFVRDGEGVPVGNLDLIANGGIAFPAGAIPDDIISVEALLAVTPPRPRAVAEAPAAYQQGLFDD